MSTFGVGAVSALVVGDLLRIWSSIELDKAGQVRPGTVGWSGMVTSSLSSAALNLLTSGVPVRLATPPIYGNTASRRRGPLEKKDAVRRF